MINWLRSQSRIGAILLCLLPLVAGVVFIQTFASPLPLTDEWNYTHALRLMHDIDPSEAGSISTWIEYYPTRHNEHLVVVPFLAYGPLMEWLQYDSR